MINNLNRLNDVLEPFDKDIKERDILEESKKNNEPFDHNKRFIDANIYTVMIEDGKVDEIISHTMSGSVNESIKDFAQDIIQTTNSEKTYIGNLYTNRYSYRYNYNNIVISDNLDINNRLISSLKLTIIVFI